MFSLIVSTLCLGALVSCAEDNVKNTSAQGYYGGSADPSTGSYYVPIYPSAPQIEDRNVCDLDATVLLVTDRRRHGQNKAVRVRCSEIANYDEDSCNTCCQNSARRDASLKNEAMYGFLAIIDNVKDSRENSEEEDENMRRKRSPRHEGETGEVDYTTLKQGSWKPDAQYQNVKCVCCAPKRALPQPVFAYQQYPSTQYQAPVQAYGQPQAAPVTQQQYGQLQAAPVQQYAPVQTQQYGAQAPAQAAPAYQAPAQVPVKAY